jgi:hypothetical protein
MNIHADKIETAPAHALSLSQLKLILRAVGGATLFQHYVSALNDRVQRPAIFGDGDESAFD